MKVMMKILRLSPRWVLDLARTNSSRLIELMRKKRRTRNSSDQVQLAQYCSLTILPLVRYRSINTTHLANPCKTRCE